MIVAAQPVLRFAIHEDGAWEHLDAWFPFVAFTREILARADGWRLAVRGDELVFTCTNGGAVYALGPLTDGVRAGRLVRSW